ncbi:hypothetical protein IC229_33585 [Spirosoma sp. BT702]|uniref:Uncharacterized protein n=1 Tax=Spirosoma profusum TaxID=2771354 RepID=A0A927AWD8_9BACT|nr:hypothetical protein [Spirosoma profusum]MBD2705589.1 hypothetical protein [Spirosoma profusum]
MITEKDLLAAGYTKEDSELPVPGEMQNLGYRVEEVWYCASSDTTLSLYTCGDLPDRCFLIADDLSETELTHPSQIP